VPRKPVSASHAEVTDRPDVETAKLEQQEHLGRPGTDAAHRGQAFDYLLIVLPGQSAGRQDHSSVKDLCRQIAQRCDLVAGKASRPKLVIGQGGHRLRFYAAIQGGDQPAMDGAGGRPS